MTQLEQLLAALGKARVDFVIVGGVAARAHGSARLTDDLDISYARAPANLDRLVKALAPLKPYLRDAPAGRPKDLEVVAELEALQEEIERKA